MVHNALSVDLEDYYQVSNFDRVVDRADWPTLPSRVATSTRRLLDAFEARDARATFFVLGCVADRHASLVREIAERGHEIACHGYGHERVGALGPERFRADLRRARRAIEDAAGCGVSGYRAPSFSITARSLWALRILAEEGFAYDSSIFPIRHPRYGIVGFPRSPLRLDLGEGRSMLEFPLTTVKGGPLVLPIAGGAYLRFLPGFAFRALFRRAAHGDQPTVLYLHPWEVDPDQPRQDVGLRVRINHYYNLGRTQQRIERLLDEHAFAPLADVLAGLQEARRLPTLRLQDAVPGDGADATLPPHPLEARS